MSNEKNIELLEVHSREDIEQVFHYSAGKYISKFLVEMRDNKKDRYSSYELDTKKVQRVVEVLRQIVPRAEDSGVYLGLENTLTARQNMDIIEQVGSDMVKVYYDVGNSWNYGYNVPEEIKLLKNTMICEVHIKDPKARLFNLADPLKRATEFNVMKSDTKSQYLERHKTYDIQNRCSEGRVSYFCIISTTLNLLNFYRYSDRIKII